jgi:octaheme c-type cytochrome (tetrathionate reductase family)
MFALRLAAGIVAVLMTAAGHVEAAPKAATPVHSRFKLLQQDFASGPEVTRACLACHKEAARQIHKTQHWKWEYVNDAGQVLGKRHVVNNFCTSTSSNFGACASCHTGYGMKDPATFDFASEENVDCLACHDTTGKYKKSGGLAGNVFARDVEVPPGSGKVIKGVDLRTVAQNVGPTSRRSCGSCHFYGGGGDGVKHGDIDSSLEAPDASVDVHMAADGLNFRCTSCHRTVGHDVPGSRYGPMSATLTCNNCHGAAPHESKRLNSHTARVACQTCHIPEFARGDVKTKMAWDWSTAGKRGPDGKPIVRRDDQGYETYSGLKGDFVWARDVVPEYIWFNGRVRYTLPADRLDPRNEPVPINHFEGGPDDSRSKIWPVKVFRGTQAWDPVNRTLAVAHLAGADDTAYWTNLDWIKAVTTGMKSAGLPFSGQVGFIRTTSIWPVTHMVAPKAKALACEDCHSKNGRLAKVPGIELEE